MKFTVDRELFVEALGRLAPIAGGSKVLPILNNVRIDILGGDDTDADHLRLVATDLETGLKITIPQMGQIMEPGSVCLDAKKLFEISKSISGPVIGVDIGDRLHTTISAGNSSFTLNGLDVADFPVWSATNADITITVPRDILAYAIDGVMFAASRDESRFNLNGVLWNVEGGSLKFVATDGHRLAMANEITTVMANDTKLIVPKKSMSAIRKFIDRTANPIDISVGPKSIELNSDNSTLLCRLLDGEYPHYQKVIPADSGVTIGVERSMIKRSLDMVRLMTSDRNRGVTLVVGKGEMTISVTTPDMGSARDTIAVEYDGDPIDLIANVEYLIDGLSALGSEKITIEYFRDGSPIILRPMGAANYFNLVMPMRK